MKPKAIKQPNPVAKHNQHRGGFHIKKHKSERRSVHSSLLEEGQIELEDLKDKSDD